MAPPHPSQETTGEGLVDVGGDSYGKRRLVFVRVRPLPLQVRIQLEKA